ncbi:MAG: hypothetical protein ACK559_12870, partial [bacterium]
MHGEVWLDDVGVEHGVVRGGIVWGADGAVQRPEGGYWHGHDDTEHCGQVRRRIQRLGHGDVQSRRRCDHVRLDYCD